VVVLAVAVSVAEALVEVDSAAAGVVLAPAAAVILAAAVLRAAGNINNNYV
jgi:hypothetical protein